jgi:hypothetical protein
VLSPFEGGVPDLAAFARKLGVLKRHEELAED